MTATDSTKFSALNTLIEKLDNRQPGTSGYITNPAELKAILNELSPLVTVGVYQDDSPHLDDKGDTVSVTIKFGITLSRSELAEAEKEATG